MGGNRAIFAPGQVWRYRTRPQEPDSLAVIGAVSERLGPGVVVHCALVGLAMQNPHMEGGVTHVLNHVALVERVFRASVTEPEWVAPTMLPTGFYWCHGDFERAVGEGHAGFYTLTLAEIVDACERACLHGVAEVPSK